MITGPSRDIDSIAGSSVQNSPDVSQTFTRHRPQFPTLRRHAAIAMPVYSKRGFFPMTEDASSYQRSPLTRVTRERKKIIIQQKGTDKQSKHKSSNENR